METIGNRIRNTRKERGLTMKQLHEETGLSTGNISDMENDKYQPSIASLVPLSQVLDVSIHWLVTGEDYVPQGAETSSQLEQDLLAMFRLLSYEEREDVFEATLLKYKRSLKKGGRSTFSTYYDQNGENVIELTEKEQNSKAIAIPGIG